MPVLEEDIANSVFEMIRDNASWRTIYTYCKEEFLKQHPDAAEDLAQASEAENRAMLILFLDAMIKEVDDRLSHELPVEESRAMREALAGYKVRHFTGS